MDRESGFGGDINTNKTTEQSGGQQHSELGHKKKEVVNNAVPYYKLFSFADSTDYMLMILGTITAIGNGLCIPFTAVVLGELTDSFGQNVNTRHVVHDVSKVPYTLTSILISLYQDKVLAKFLEDELLSIANNTEIKFLPFGAKYFYLPERKLVFVWFPFPFLHDDLTTAILNHCKIYFLLMFLCCRKY